MTLIMRILTTLFLGPGRFCRGLTTYDAAYVAAAERYRCPLVTTDARLARAAGIQMDCRAS